MLVHLDVAGLQTRNQKGQTMTTTRRMTVADAYRARRGMEQNPGKWIELPTHAKDAKHYVYRARAGQIVAFPPSEFEFEFIDGKPMGRTRKHA